MIRKILIISTLTITTNYLLAQHVGALPNNQNRFLILLTLGIAILALIVSVINYLRISYNKNIAEVNLVNQKDDLHVTMEAVKESVSRDLRYFRKEFGRNQRIKNEEKTNVKGPKTEDDRVKEENKPVEKKPFKKRSSNFKRRPPHRKSQDKNMDGEQTKE